MNIPVVLFFPFRVMEELTQQKLLPGLQVEELQSREDPLEVSFAPLWAGGSLLWLVAVLLMRSFLIKPEGAVVILLPCH